MKIVNKDILVICIFSCLLSLGWFKAFSWAQLFTEAHVCLGIFAISALAGLHFGVRPRTNQDQKIVKSKV